MELGTPSSQRLLVREPSVVEQLHRVRRHRRDVLLPPPRAPARAGPRWPTLTRGRPVPRVERGLRHRRGALQHRHDAAGRGHARGAHPRDGQRTSPPARCSAPGPPRMAPGRVRRIEPSMERRFLTPQGDLVMVSSAGAAAGGVPPPQPGARRGAGVRAGRRLLPQRPHLLPPRAGAAGAGASSSARSPRAGCSSCRRRRCPSPTAWGWSSSTCRARRCSGCPGLGPPRPGAQAQPPRRHARPEAGTAAQAEGARARLGVHGPPGSAPALRRPGGAAPAAPAGAAGARA